MKSPRFLILLLTVSMALVAAGCGGADDSANEAPGGDTGAPTETAAADPCAKDQLQTTSAGKLTIGTDNPAFPPWFQDAEGAPWDPTKEPTKEGYEAAVAYAVAGELGFSDDEVAWQVVPFEQSFKPGPKNFDFDINQVSYTPKRAEAVDFSDSYYDVNQAVVALKGSKIADADLDRRPRGREARRSGRHDELRLHRPERVSRARSRRVYNTLNDAIAGLKAKQIDGVVVDLPTAFFMTAVQVPNGNDRGSVPGRRDTGVLRPRACEGQPAHLLRERRAREAPGRRDAR